METLGIISKEAEEEITKLFEHLPKKSAACIDALMVVQKYNRWVSDDALKALAPILEMSADEIDSVATFYNHVYRLPVGRHVIKICDSVSCYIMGYETIRDAFKERLKIDFGETTPDDRFTLLPVECLGACDCAPTLIIDSELYRNVKIDQLDAILSKYE